MKKILKAVLSAAILCLTAVIMSVCVSAETEDVELSTSMAKTTTGAWGQSVTYPNTTFDCSRFTPDTVVQVEFELDGEWTGNGAPVELVLQNYSTSDPPIWAKTEPFEFDDTSASFSYEDMAAAFGSEDFDTVDNLILGDCGIKMKATKFIITNCEAVVVTTTEATTTTAAETTTASETTTAATTTVAAETEAPSQSGSGSIPIVPIVIVTVVVAVIIVVVIIVIKNKRRFY